MAAPKPPCLTAALEYLERGWSPVPLCPPDHAGMPDEHVRQCQSPGKAPAGPWKYLTAHRPTRNMVEVWWRRWPAANVGLALGPVSGLLGLDVDGAEGEQLLARLSGASAPPTLEFTTGKGRRLLYAWPAAGVPNKEYRFGTGEVRVLAKGRQTVMPPSLHPTGPAYAWVPGCRPGELEPAPCPAWLLELLALGTQPPAPAAPSQPHRNPPADCDKGRRAGLYLQKCDPAVSGQGGHAKTFEVARAVVWGFDLGPDAGFELLWAEYNPRCLPPWSEKELRHKCQEAHTRPFEKPRGWLLNEPGPGAGAAPTPWLREPGEDPPEPGVPVPDAADGGAPGEESGPAPPEIITAADLCTREFPPMRWAVEGILPEGATIFAGPPKAGKSFLTLGLTLAVASGGTALGKIRVKEGEVLYLALEDGYRRLQGRLRKIMRAQNLPAPPLLHLATQWPRSSDGGLSFLADWIDRHPACRLVVIDTLAKIRDRRLNADNLYEGDYEAIGQLQQLGLRRNLAVLILHHTRKLQGDDPLGDVSGTQGYTGAADVVLVLKRARQARDAQLFMTGRDVEEQTLSLSWEPQYCLWAITEEPDASDPEAQLSPDQRSVLDLLQDAGRPLALLEITGRLRKPYEATAKLLQRMVSYGLLKKTGHGQYAHPDAAASAASSCPNAAQPQPVLEFENGHGLDKDLSNSEHAADAADRGEAPPGPFGHELDNGLSSSPPPEGPAA